MSEYTLKIPEGCKVESVSMLRIDSESVEELYAKDTIIVVLAPEFNPKPGDYVVTDDGQAGINTKSGFYRLGRASNLPFTRYASDTQKDEFDKLLKEAGLMYDRYSEDVIELPKEGDLCIFWDGKLTNRAIIHLLDGFDFRGCPTEISGDTWQNCIKFESEEQFRKLILKE